MNHVVKIVGTIVVTFVILVLPILTCLSIVLEWDGLISTVLCAAVAFEAVLVAVEVYERSEDA